MTREEAIATLKKAKQLVAIYPKRRKQKSAVQELTNALDMAIDALTHDIRTETHECVKETHDSDLIRRAEVLNLFPNAFYDGLASQIKALPSADITETETCKKCQETTDRILINQGEEIKSMHDKYIELLADRPMGEWQRVDEQPYFRKHYHKVCCSVCHKQGSEKYNYCPSCGAYMRMKGGGNE